MHPSILHVVHSLQGAGPKTAARQPDAPEALVMATALAAMGIVLAPATADHLRPRVRWLLEETIKMLAVN
jgi:hypothetical protein